MYSIVLAAALTAGHSAPQGWCLHTTPWNYGNCYGACYGVCYGGFPECFPVFGFDGPAGSIGYSDPAFGMPAPGIAPAVETTGEQQANVPNRARLIVTLPHDARLYVDNIPIQAGATERGFRTPELEKSREYYYEVRAEVMRDGKPVSQTRRVTVKAGEVLRTDFRSLEAASAPASVAKR